MEKATRLLIGWGGIMYDVVEAIGITQTRVLGS